MIDAYFMNKQGQKTISKQQRWRNNTRLGNSHNLYNKKSNTVYVLDSRRTIYNCFKFISLR